MSEETGPAANIERERWRLLAHITRFTDKVMTALAFVWLGLMIWEFTHGLTPPLQWLGYGIWVLFGLDFLVKLLIAPNRLTYLRKNWLTLLALVLPAFRAIRILRAARALRAIRLARVVTSLNRGMGAVGRAMRRRGAGYVIAVTILVVFAGAAGMYQFENPAELISQGQAAVVDSGGGLPTYGDALWWTTMIMTTMGSAYWPVTPEGRFLCLLLALYASAIFGYITATIASLFIRRDTTEAAPDAAALKRIEADLRGLRNEISRLARNEGAHNDVRR